jgi:cysteine desulfurase
MNYPDTHYFDYAASAPPFITALERYKEVSQKFYVNPSSSHNPGKIAMRFLMEQKEQFCNFLNFNDGRLIICSSGTEANNTIIEGHLRKNPGGRILIAENVHSSVWYITEKYKSIVDIIKIDYDGQVNPDRFRESLKPDTSLVCINHVCNETGAIQSFSNIAPICSERKIKLLIDGAQAIGHIPIDMELIQSDYYSFSAHKFGAGRSFGGLMIRDDSFYPLLSGGKQEWGLRAGTENIGGLAAGMVALQESLVIIKQEEERLRDLKNSFIKRLKLNITDLLINSPEIGLPGFVSLSFPGFSGSEIAGALSLEGFYISTGSACHDNLYKPSRVILAIGRNEKEAIGTIRITMGRGTTEQSVRDLSEAIIGFICK